jgi:hypothetical protein
MFCSCYKTVKFLSLKIQIMRSTLPVFVIAVTIVLVCTSFTSFHTIRDRVSLFNGKDLSGWDTYIGPMYDSVAEKFAGDPMGLNKDPKGVFTVVKEDGNPAIRISGEQFGGLSTQQEFTNYHLRLEFKWGKLKWAPKKNAKRDSGLLYHAVGPHATDWFFWMRSQEFQIQEGDCGDYWGCGGAFATVPAKKEAEKRYVYSPSGEMLLFRDKGPNGRNCIKTPDAEKPTGEWNTIDLYCYGDTSVHMVNGKVVMVLYKLSQPQDNDQSALTKGKIQLQSEGAEIFYRNFELEEIAAIPGKLLK